MEKLKKIFSKVKEWMKSKKDKVLHFIVSFFIMAVLSAFIPLWLALILSVAIGLAKEFVCDRWMKKGTFDRYDIVANVAGSSLYLIIEIL